MRSLLAFLLCTALISCATFVGHQLDQRYGRADPARFDRSAARSDDASWQEVKSIFDHRCTVCHGCYDAPCQLNLTAYEGVTRGANPDKVYNAARVIASEPTRLFIDAHSNAAWRNKGFHPVLNERPNADADHDGSIMYRLLALKRAHPLPSEPVLSGKDFDFSLDRSQQCPTIEEIDQFEQKYPLWGMPYGLPGLSEHEHDALTSWLSAGAPAGAPVSLTPAEVAQIAEWEQFLNGTDLKTQLMSRYLYEHLFLGSLYFEGQSPTRFFRLVRSSTPPGMPVISIATRRPYDDPNVAQVYYRLEAMHATVLNKTHLPYALSPARRARWEELFLYPDYTVTTLPGYAPELAANPFATFRELPVLSRYRFLLDDTQFFVMGFIKGPVCRGQVALNVINDRFWVMFVDPDKIPTEESETFLANESKHLRLPHEEGSSSLALIPWLKYSRLQKEYLEARTRYMHTLLMEQTPITLDLVWDGDGHNPNAALTVFRHFDSASVVRGFIGEPPKTAWVIGYPLLERIHYLLVAGFDVHGNAGHQLNTRLYMDFLRMEGEFNFLVLLPMAARLQERDFWYRQATDEVKDFIQGQYLNVQADSEVHYRTDQPKQELFAMLQDRLHPILETTYPLSGEPDPVLREQLARLAAAPSRAASLMPETAFLSVVDQPGKNSGDAVYTILRDSAHLNISHLFDQTKQRVPEEDTLTVVRGFLGAYPNAFYQVSRAELPAFVDTVARLDSEDGYAALMTRFGIRRTDPRFWAHSDRLLRAYAEAEPISSGLFDYNRLENR